MSDRVIPHNAVRLEPALHPESLTAPVRIQRGPSRMGLWWSAVVLVFLALPLTARAAWRHARDSHESQAAFTWFAGSGSLWAMFSQLIQGGWTPQSTGAFLGGLGTFLMGLTSLLREIKASRKEVKP